MSPISEADQRAVAKYVRSNYDRIELKVPKGKRDIIKVHAENFQKEVGIRNKAGYSPAGSVNAFINRAIDNEIERDKNTSSS